MNYKIAQLTITPSKNASSLADVYIANPDEALEQVAGRLFALVEAGSKTADDFKIVNFLIDQIEHNYYQHEKFSLEDAEKMANVEHIFEAALAKTNKNLIDFLRDEKLSFDPASLNATVGIICENRLHFANVGNNRAFLIYKDKSQTQAVKNKAQNSKNVLLLNETRYKAVNIIEQVSGNADRPVINETKIFSSVMSGMMPTGGYLVFSNETLPEYLSQKQLIDIVTALPPASAAEQLKNTLSEVNEYISFLAIIIKNTIGMSEEELWQETMRASAKNSISNLNAVEDTTEKLLSPGGYINFKKWLKKTAASFSRFLRNIIGFSADKLPETDGLTDKVLAKRKTVSMLIGRLVSLIGAIFAKIFSSLVGFFKFIASPSSMAVFSKVGLAKARSSMAGLKNALASVVDRLLNLSKLNKVLGLVLIASIVLFAVNIAKTGSESRKNTEAAITAETMKSIEQKQNQIEANMLYGNDDMIRTLLADTKTLLDKLPKSADGSNPYQPYYDRFNSQLEKNRHVEMLDNLIVLSDFSKLDMNADPDSLIMMAGNEDVLYSSDLGARTVYKFSLKENSATPISLGSSTASLAFPSADKTSIYYINSDSVTVLNAESGKTARAPIAITGDFSGIADVKAFNNRLYIANRQDGQIYRHTREANGFSRGERWLTEAADLANASSMHIDGNVYLIKTDGQMLKFLKGGEEKAVLEPVEPAISGSAKLIVGADAGYVYVLEPSQARLVIFDGNGQFILQYKSKQFTDLKDFAVNEKAKAIYFLNGATILQADARHMK